MFIVAQVSVDVHVIDVVVLGVFGLAGPVLATVVVEVVVLSFICDHRDGSGSRDTRRLVENHGGGSCTHVVVELDGTNVLEGSHGTRRVPKPKWYLAISGTVLTFRCGVVVHVNGHRGTSFRSCSRSRHWWTFEGLAYSKGYLAIDGRRGT